MASSMSVWCEIVNQGLVADRKRRHAELARLRDEGVEIDEAQRRVYYPWKSLQEYRAMMAEYDRAYAIRS